MQVQSASERIEECVTFDSLLGSGPEIRPDGVARLAWNVRAVGFISKPEKTVELSVVIESLVNHLLCEFAGFSGAIVLRSQNETRNLLVLSFWETEKQAATTHWEGDMAVRRAISPLADVCTKVQTFRATAATTRAQSRNRKSMGARPAVCA